MKRFHKWHGLTSIKQRHNGDRVDAQARDILYNDKLYDDIVNVKLFLKLSELARADGYITDGWHNVDYDKVAQKHEKELMSYLEEQEPSLVKSNDIETWNIIVLEKYD